MIVLSFKSKRDKERLLEKARKMEEYASMIVECIEDSRDYEDEYDERSYRGNEEDMMDMNDRMMGTNMSGRYGYRRRMR
jgi:coenzyme F420-reducing hydrogenase alpha subunit